MAEAKLSRQTRNVDVVVDTSVSASTSIACGDMAAALVHVAGVTASATLTVLGSADGQTFVPVFDSSGAASTVTIPAEGGAVVLPEAAFALKFVKLTSGDGLGTAATVAVTLKS